MGTDIIHLRLGVPDGSEVIWGCSCRCNIGHISSSYEGAYIHIHRTPTSHKAWLLANLSPYEIGSVADSSKESLHFQLARLQPHHPGSSALQTIGVLQQGGADSTLVSRGLESFRYCIQTCIMDLITSTI